MLGCQMESDSNANVGERGLGIVGEFDRDDVNTISWTIDARRVLRLCDRLDSSRKEGRCPYQSVGEKQVNVSPTLLLPQPIFRS